MPALQRDYALAGSVSVGPHSGIANRHRSRTTFRARPGAGRGRLARSHAGPHRAVLRYPRRRVTGSGKRVAQANDAFDRSAGRPRRARHPGEEGTPLPGNTPARPIRDRRCRGIEAEAAGPANPVRHGYPGRAGYGSHIPGGTPAAFSRACCLPGNSMRRPGRIDQIRNLDPVGADPCPRCWARSGAALAAFEDIMSGCPTGPVHTGSGWHYCCHGCRIRRGPVSWTGSPRKV